MNEHTVIAALGVGFGIVAAFIAWTYIAPLITSAKTTAA